MRLILIGDIDLLKDFDTIFSLDHKCLISRTLGADYFFEMSGESMYYALIEEERKSGKSLLNYKKRIVDAILYRLTLGEGKLLHRSFTGGFDTQFRATSSAIRTLLLASKDGFSVIQALRQLILFHFSYYFQWNEGIWFCHDSSELEGKNPFFHLKRDYRGKTKRNTLTLNTHIDSINTLLLIKKYQFVCDLDVDDLLRRSFKTVNYLLKISGNWFSHKLQKVDNYFLDNNVKYLNKGGKWYLNFYERVMHPLFFKLLFPTFFFDNGFIARDLAVPNRHLDYLLVNIVDLSRLLNLYQAVMIDDRDLDAKQIYNKIHHGIDWLERHPDFIEFVSKNSLQSAWYAEMYYALSNLDSKYSNKARELFLSGLYCSYSPFYAIDFMS